MTESVTVRCVCEHGPMDHLTGEYIYQGTDYALALGACRVRRCECDHFAPQQAVLRGDEKVRSEDD